MQGTGLKSFTLPEMLVVMIITAIVVGMAFSVLSLVQKQVRSIQKNFDRTTQLSLLEQRLWQDFNSYNTVSCQDEKLTMLSDRDTVHYSFTDDFVLINKDTTHVRLKITKLFYQGREVRFGTIDAVAVSADAELPGYSFFVSSTPDATLNMNNDGF